jgi:hypothetical protein
MKIPSQITIGGIDWNVKFHSKDFPNHNNESMVANLDFRYGIINISEDIHEQLVDLSFLHELIHAIDYSMGYLTDDKDPESMPISEKTVEQRAQLLLQVIKQLIDFNIISEMTNSTDIKIDSPKSILNIKRLDEPL